MTLRTSSWSVQRQVVYRCNVRGCHERFPTSRTLALHRRKRGHYEDFVYAPALQNKDVACSMCSFVPWYLCDNPKQSLRQHMRRVHKVYVRIYKIQEEP